MSHQQKTTDPETIHAGWLIDGSGGAVQENVRLRIQDGLIATIESSDQNREERSEVLDLTGDTIPVKEWPAGNNCCRIVLQRFSR